jgi:hypothetical protein
MQCSSITWIDWILAILVGSRHFNGRIPSILAKSGQSRLDSGQIQSEFGPPESGDGCRSLMDSGAV